jgi:hypothetical protein
MVTNPDLIACERLNGSFLDLLLVQEKFLSPCRRGEMTKGVSVNAQQDGVGAWLQLYVVRAAPILVG